MTRLVPHPLLSMVLLLTWLLLTRFTPGHLLLGSVVAVTAGQALAALQPRGPRVRNWHRLPGLVARVIYDVVHSNIEVTWGMLLGARRRSGIVEIRLRLRTPAGLAWLAIILTATPGTIWLDHDPESGTLLLHFFRLTDPEHARALVRRYEEPLMEMLG